jgi:exosome complex RNA-binding protein Csl4
MTRRQIRIRTLVVPRARACPDCGGPLVHGEGCVTCPVCGFSACS